MTYDETPFYRDTAGPIPGRPVLEGDVRADVAIVGGGYTGLAAALHLACDGFDAVLLEAGEIGSGASGRNGGQVGTGQRRPVEELERRYGPAHARQLWDLSEEARGLVMRLIADHAIDCHPRPGIIDAAHKRRYLDAYRRHVDHMRDVYGYNGLTYVEGDDFRQRVASPDFHGGIVDSGALHLHPLRYALGLARAAERSGARLFAGSRVERIGQEGKVTLETASGTVTADHAIIACNGYLGHLQPALARKILPINNFIIATEPLGEAGARALIAGLEAVCDSRWVVNYLRFSSDYRLVFGGGETYGMKFPDDIRTFVRPHMLEIFPQLADVRIDYGWGGTVGITPVRLPCFMKVGNRVWAAGGFSGHGISIGTLAGAILAEAIGGRLSRFDIMARIDVPDFPGGTRLRHPLLVLAMLWGRLRDRLGV
ncbi:MAG: FAD-binding oxidoreductase [Geminicoccaceae bacterium]